MSDAEVKCPREHLHGLLVAIDRSKVVPQPERDAREHESACADACVGHGRVAGRAWQIMHGALCRTKGARFPRKTTNCLLVVRAALPTGLVLQDIGERLCIDDGEDPTLKSRQLRVVDAVEYLIAQRAKSRFKQSQQQRLGGVQMLGPTFFQARYVTTGVGVVD